MTLNLQTAKYFTECLARHILTLAVTSLFNAIQAAPVDG